MIFSYWVLLLSIEFASLFVCFFSFFLVPLVFIYIIVVLVFGLLGFVFLINWVFLPGLELCSRSLCDGRQNPTWELLPVSSSWSPFFSYQVFFPPFRSRQVRSTLRTLCFPCYSSWICYLHRICFSETSSIH